jgi:hypothetical protein
MGDLVHGEGYGFGIGNALQISFNNNSADFCRRKLLDLPYMKSGQSLIELCYDLDIIFGEEEKEL